MKTETPRTWKCWLGLFVLCWAVERWKGLSADYDRMDEVPRLNEVAPASETLRHSRMRLDI